MCAKAHFAPNLQLPWADQYVCESAGLTGAASESFHTLAKYLHGVSTVEISVECEKGHAFPA